ncbi:Fanconi anemia group M protein [Ooceraea biroi]|uniref:Fanconi anemia group M protein n=2 Tax=Ooceraea biroi TaxID=2015173 RepID=A0A026WPH9_OOCBI|nr:Fanconi anemia group M protein [Ooceraea biroi]
MYNFWRWYPFGKIVFLAPTKPLVAQQIDACYEVMGIPNIDMIQLTGAVNQKNREVAWLKKRIIFATPQTFHNDLEKSIVPSHLVKCVVVDEAHRALGKHSYCECIRILSMRNQYFRILALSATPGNKMDNVHEVIQNLRISHLELRDENSIDMMPYVNKRKVDVILIPLSDELAAFKERYIVIMDRHVKFLIQCNVLRGHTANISKGRVFHLLNDFKNRMDKSGNYGQIMKTLNILLTMYHAYELMIRHGLRAFCKFYQTHSDKFWIHSENQLRGLLHDIESYLGPFPDILPNGDVLEIPADLVFGHNKFYKLRELLEHHFRSNNGDQRDTRAIVFVEYRDIVNEVYVLLLQSKPIIRPQMFVGQAGQKQKQQIKALEDFRSNRVNVLISTSIGEEGLDVGEVDLIICFDVSQHSPTRLVQRMGRTGRKRDGHIIVLVTDGKEHENLKSTLSRRDSLNNKILNTSNIFSSLYDNNPRMIPKQFTPECHKIHIIALPRTPHIKEKRKRKNVLKKNEAPNAKQKENLSIMTQKDTGQSSMMKFLTNNKYNQHDQHNTHNVLIESRTQSNNLHNVINPNDVKLLSDDNARFNFLTLCAVKKSEEEMSSGTARQMDVTYIPAPKPVKDVFNFVVPDIKMIDSLPFLTRLRDGSLTQCKSCEDDLPATCKNGDDAISNDCIVIDDDDDDDRIFWCSIRHEEHADKSEIKFEDILDESSDSNETSMSRLSQRITNIGMDFINEISTANVKSDSKSTTNVRAEVSADVLDDIGPSMFEDILNESFSSTEDGLDEEEETAQPDTIFPNPSSSAFATGTAKISESTVNFFRDEDNVNRPDENLPVVSEKIAGFNRANNSASLIIIDDMQDLDFDSDDDINGFINCEFEKNKSMRNSRAEESSLSITQAIGEIARMKRDPRRLAESSKEESIDSTGWISVNTKCEAKTERQNTSSRVGIRLSNINRKFTMKPRAAKQECSFPDDSDEEFMITEDNARKFDELESSYFRDMSKNSAGDDNCLPGTSRNTEIKHSSSNASNNSEAENSFDNISKNLKPCGMSTPNSRRPGLSLNRNKSHHSNMIDLTLFKAPNKYARNARDENISESGTATPTGQTSVLARSVAQDIKRGRRRRNIIKNEFIDDEAQVASDESSSSGESVIVTDEEEDLADFVSYTQNLQEQVDMHAHYLQTTKSPIKRPGAFHFRKPRSPVLDEEIYSQPLSQAQNTYLYDSFCVSEDAEPSILVHDDSILERVEEELERNKRKRFRSEKDGKRAKRKKKNILDHSVSSEDEIEQLRVQVQED